MSRRPKVWIAASAAYFACASFVTSSETVRTLTPNLPARSARSPELRAVASTRCPALRASSVKARPRPREAPVISQTFDMLTSFTSLPTSSLANARGSLFDQSGNLLRPGEVDRVAGAWDLDLVTVGARGIPAFEVGVDGSVASCHQHPARFASPRSPGLGNYPPSVALRDNTPSSILNSMAPVRN